MTCVATTNLIDGSVITAIFTGMAAVIGSISTLLYKNFRDRKRGDYVTCAECEAHRKAFSSRLDELLPAVRSISKKIDDWQKRDEDRAVQLHRRIDPLFEKVAATAAEVEMMKKGNR